MKFLLRYSFAFLLFFFLTPQAFAQDADINLIKKRVLDELLRGGVRDGEIENILSRIEDDGRFSGINYADLSRTAGFPHRFHTAGLFNLAKAYKIPSSRYYQDKQLKAKLEKSLRFWAKNDFIGDNWHDNQITTPTNLVHLLLVIGDELPKDLVDQLLPIVGRAHMNASGARPSGDRIVIAGILAKSLLFQGKYDEFDQIIRIIEGELKFSTGERGMQHDYSFHHRVDRVNNTSSYGYGKYANAFGEWSYYVAGTRYKFSQEKINHLIDYYLEGVYKQMVYGVYDDVSVKNRSITQKTSFTPKGTLEIERLLVSTNYRKDELEEIIRLRKGESKPSASFAKFFWQTEHFVIQRPCYYTTVRMFSTRNRNMEEPYNGPGKPTHHRADGTNYLMLKGDEYHDIWPVYDWQKISGTTIVQKPALPSPTEIQKEGLTDFVGAVTDGMIGAVVFDFKSPHDPLEAKKSWFFFDQEYVCLGTDIQSKSEFDVVTTVNQTLMRGDVKIEQNGSPQTLPRGKRSLSNVKWVHHNQIGYLFPEPATVTLSNQTETGRWSDITDQKNISTELVSKDVFSLWFDHGKKPRKASYAYIVVPCVSEDALRETSRNNRSIKIVSNNDSIQAVIHQKEGIVQAVFYKAGTLDIGEGKSITVDSPGLVMLKAKNGRITELTVADPSRKLNRINLWVDGQYTSKGDQYRTLTEGQKTLFIIDLPQGVYSGKSTQIRL
ncbi:MAG: polysaccharide lyase family 8 super-sandwich domain-containing protein [Spirosomataceae bacterium]